jgi:hypothetical protein
MLFKNSVRTSKRTPYFTITKINWLMLFKEIIAVYSEHYKQHMHTERSFNDCRRRWYIYLLLGLKRLSSVNKIHFTLSVSPVTQTESVKRSLVAVGLQTKGGALLNNT